MAITAPRGTQDFLPEQTAEWQLLEAKIRQICSLYGFGEIRIRHIVWQPIYLEAAAFHAAEPRHLPLGKLMDGYLQLAQHILTRELTQTAKGQVFVFQSIIHEVFGRHMPEQTFHLLQHPLLHAVVKPLGNLLPAQIAVDIDAYRKATQRGEFPFVYLVFTIVLLYLDGSDGALGCIYISGIVQRLVCAEQFSEFLQRTSLKFLAQLRVLGYRHHLVTLEDGLDVEARSTTQDGKLTPAADVVIGIPEILLELEEVVFVARIGYVYQMIRDAHPLYLIVGKVLSRADVHPPIHLAAVCAYDFGIAHHESQPCGQ